MLEKFARRHKQITFSGAGFLGALRVNRPLESMPRRLKYVHLDSDKEPSCLETTRMFVDLLEWSLNIDRLWYRSLLLKSHPK